MSNLYLNRRESYLLPKPQGVIWLGARSVSLRVAAGLLHIRRILRLAAVTAITKRSFLLYTVRIILQSSIVTSWQHDTDRKRRYLWSFLGDTRTSEVLGCRIVAWSACCLIARDSRPPTYTAARAVTATENSSFLYTVIYSGCIISTRYRLERHIYLLVIYRPLRKGSLLPKPRVAWCALERTTVGACSRGVASRSSVRRDRSLWGAPHAFIYKNGKTGNKCLPYVQNREIRLYYRPRIVNFPHLSKLLPEGTKLSIPPV